LSVDSYPGKTLSFQFPKNPGNLLFFRAAQGSQDQKATSPGPCAEGFPDHLRDGVGADFQPTSRAVESPQARIQQAKEVRDLREGAYGGSGRAHNTALVDGDGRAEPLDFIDFRRIQVWDGVPIVETEGLEVAPLSFGKEGVEGQGGLAGPAHTRDHDETIPGKGKVNVLQVVLPGSLDDDSVHGLPLNPEKRTSGGSGSGSGGRQPVPSHGNRKVKGRSETSLIGSSLTG